MNRVEQSCFYLSFKCQLDNYLLLDNDKLGHGDCLLRVRGTLEFAKLSSLNPQNCFLVYVDILFYLSNRGFISFEDFSSNQ